MKEQGTDTVLTTRAAIQKSHRLLPLTPEQSSCMQHVPTVYVNYAQLSILRFSWNVAFCRLMLL